MNLIILITKLYKKFFVIDLWNDVIHRIHYELCKEKSVVKAGTSIYIVFNYFVTRDILPDFQRKTRTSDFKTFKSFEEAPFAYDDDKEEKAV